VAEIRDRVSQDGAHRHRLETIRKGVYCGTNGIKSLKGHYHKDWNFKAAYEYGRAFAPKI
jgi:hypothetical protein